MSTIKKLFSLSGNQCAFPGCTSPIYDTQNEVLLGEVCHIHSAEAGGERYDPNQTEEERRDISNLILLCAHHHLTTNHVEKYSAEAMQKMKTAHESRQKSNPIPKIDEKIINENYVKILRKEDFLLDTVMLLDKVQKQKSITLEEAKFLREKKLIEGRYPEIFVVSTIAAATGNKASYIKNRGRDKQFYKDMILDYLKEFGSASRKELDELLIGKLSDILSEKQKRAKINNLIYEMAKKEKYIKNTGTKKQPKWILY
jgi:hypothetical protein